MPPRRLPASDAAALTEAVRHHLDQPATLTGTVSRAGLVDGQWHLLLEAADSDDDPGVAARLIVAPEALDAVQRRLGRPIAELPGTRVEAVGPLRTLAARPDRPLIRITAAEQLALPASP